MRKLLIIDDRTEFLEIIEKIVSLYNFTVRTATDRETLLKELESFKPEVLIIDVLLNGEDGRQICKEVRENPLNKKLTLILLSSSPDKLENFQECGADGFLEKPFGIKELMEKVETAIQSREEYLANNT